MTVYGMRISDWSSDVCSSDLGALAVDQEQRWRFPDAKARGKLDIGLPPVVERPQGTPCRLIARDDVAKMKLLDRQARSDRLRGARLLGRRLQRDELVGGIGPGQRRHGRMRSEERRVGKGCVRTCRSRWSRYHKKKKKRKQIKKKG